MPRKPLTAPRKKASQDRSKVTVDTLLDATARVLVKDGYDYASTNRIAEAAGVSIGSLYQYFPSKEALVAGVIDRHIGVMTDRVRTHLLRVASMPIAEAARELVKMMIDVHRMDPKLHRVLVEQTPRVGNLDRVNDMGEEATTLVRAYLEVHKDEIDVEDLDLAAWICVSCVEALTHIAVLRRPNLLDDDRFIDEVANVVVRYLKAGSSCYAATR
ncbi:Transcriptional regulator, TetR family [Labilithrix luteola]|uniref:Transcriptional regulator, TetR family n=1 Tax=Labilithrix luteola TaxID=1391654 RepID=A0A0K1PLQ9_9BACT|nr:TetR/AcrR family transcriptional regulator [Labilithrix luteola]AKU94049.1 Transcriptional regulator, TetR family [Labilithrix luteola]